LKYFLNVQELLRVNEINIVKIIVRIFVYKFRTKNMHKSLTQYKIFYYIYDKYIGNYFLCYLMSVIWKDISTIQKLKILDIIDE